MHTPTVIDTINNFFGITAPTDVTFNGYILYREDEELGTGKSGEFTIGVGPAGMLMGGDMKNFYFTEVTSCRICPGNGALEIKADGSLTNPSRKTKLLFVILKH